MAATVDPRPKKLQQNAVLKFKNLEVAEGERFCMFWSGYSEKNPDGWSDEGCHVVRSESSSVQTECSCNHMTHFAVLVGYGDNLEITKTDEKILTILTYIGLAVSIIGIILTIISYVYFTDVHQPLSQIRISLASSLGAGQVIFLAGINATGNTTVCVAVAALTQYFLMAAFFWMFVEGIYLYLFVGKVYNINNKMTIYHVMSWCFPAVMVAISLSIAAGKDGIQSLVSDEYCWMTSDNNLIWMFVVFVAMIDVVCISMLVRVIKKTTTIQPTEETHIQQIRLDTKACAVLIPFLGVTWLFAILSPRHKAFVYTFTILYSTQGFLIFFFHCVSNIQITERIRARVNVFRIGRSANVGISPYKTPTVSTYV
ncbi:adhesion G protein-coupled receptor L4-like isoform X2 [Orbicella faveolata]|uniref:adhesion G protein-coupled receptor L4-like isoform X2 n=1 Tax=Orbicella faveolata TaxID=48498 RepID=UPI0009E4E9C4|nr:adhesion G protein-coupled receptor L4-like isoform X2 [Orbicella faveolata]